MGIFDIVKPKWQHSDPNVRIKEIKNLGESNQPIIDSVAQRDKNADVRRLAIKKVMSLDLLISISKNDSDSSLRELAQQRFSEIIVKELKKESDTAKAEKLFSHLTDQKSIEEVALSAKVDSVRLKAVQGISKETVCAQIAKDDSSEEVAMAAVKKIEKINLLEAVQKYSKHTRVRAVVNERLSHNNRKEKEKSEDKFDQSKRDVLLKTLNSIYASDTITDRMSQVNALYEEGKKLFVAASKEAKETLEQIVSDIKIKIEHAERAFQASEDKKQRESDATDAAKAVCESLEETLNLGKEGITDARVDEIKAEWASLMHTYSDVTAALQSYEKRFTRTLERINSRFNELEEAKLNQAERIERRKDLVEQLSHLKDGADSKTFFKQLKSLDALWSGLGQVSDAERELEARYQQIKNDIQGRVDQAYEEQRSSVKAKMEKLESLCTDVESLNEDDAFEKILQVLKEKQQEWKEIVGEEKSKYQKVFLRFKQATSRFDEMRDWELWHNEKKKNSIIEEANTLGQIQDDKELYATINALKTRWRSVGHVPVAIVEDIWKRFNDALEPHYARCNEFFKRQEEQFEENLSTKKRIIDSIKTAIESAENWKEQSIVVKNLQEEWKAIGFVAKDKVKELQEEYRKVCDAFYEKKRTFLKSEDDQRHLNLEQKSLLCEEAESIVDSDQWQEITERLKVLQSKWKQIGSVPKEQSDPIWARFRNACDTFFEKKRLHFEKIDESKTENLQRKEALCERLEKVVLDPSKAEDVATFEAIKKEWEEIGHVPKEQSDTLFERFVTICDIFLEKQMAVDPLVKKEVEIKKEKKRALIKKAEELSESSEWKETSDQLKDLQTEWRNIGRVGKEDPVLWKEFRRQCDEFFDRKRDTYEIMQQNRLNNFESKLVLCEQAERLAEREYDDEVIREIKLLRERWKEIGAVPKKESDKIWKRFNSACDSVFEKRKNLQES